MAETVPNKEIVLDDGKRVTVGMCCNPEEDADRHCGTMVLGTPHFPLGEIRPAGNGFLATADAREMLAHPLNAEDGNSRYLVELACLQHGFLATRLVPSIDEGVDFVMDKSKAAHAFTRQKPPVYDHA